MHALPDLLVIHTSIKGKVPVAATKTFAPFLARFIRIIRIWSNLKCEMMYTPG
jgi:hypothetical protein